MKIEVKPAKQKLKNPISYLKFVAIVEKVKRHFKLKYLEEIGDGFVYNYSTRNADNHLVIISYGKDDNSIIVHSSVCYLHFSILNFMVRNLEENIQIEDLEKLLVGF